MSTYTSPHTSASAHKGSCLSIFRGLPWRSILLVFGFFVVVSLGYFSPAHFEGRELFQSDVAGSSGNGSDVRATGETAYWTNSLFGGMPMYQISPSYPSTEPLQYLQEVLTLRKPFNLLGTYPWLIFALLLGGYLFLRSLRLSLLPSVLGSVMWAFSSYFIILIDAGHIWKLTTLAFIPPTLAGLIWCYGGRRLLGGVLFALFMGLQILSNHLQMSYYFGLVMLILAGCYLVAAIRQRRIKSFLGSTGVLLVAGILALAMNVSNLYHTYEYAQETMRGGSELTLGQSTPSGGVVVGDVNNQGLSKDYITQWSYGIGETLSLMVPNVKGGATEMLGQHHRDLLSTAPSQMQPVLAQMNAYWGDQPYTAGPVYVGAFVVLLFLIGCVMVRGPLKWGLLIATLLSILLSWGRNFMPLTDFFIDYIPLYDKFRAVSSILVIAELTIPTLAVITLVQMVQDPSRLRSPWVWRIIALVVVALVVVGLLVPGWCFSFLSEQEHSMFSQMAAEQPLYITLRDQLITLRERIFRQDVWRSLIVIAVSLVPLFLYARRLLRPTMLYLLLIGITLVDLWMVDKRYLSDEDFISRSRVAQQAAPRSAADEVILQDRELGFRVFNTTVNSFNDATTSRWHHSVGGYHAAKLQRYQDLIDHQLSRGKQQAFDMLNTKYFIMRDESGAPQAIVNPGAFGAAWFVDHIDWVDNADAEMLALDSVALRHVAVVDKRFAGMLPAQVPSADSVAQRQIRVSEYTPSRVSYQVHADRPGVAVLSDIYYPHGWRATIDGKLLPIARADYVLRAVALPAGDYTLELTFAPKSLRLTEMIAFCALSVVAVALVLLLISPLLPCTRRWGEECITLF